VEEDMSMDHWLAGWQTRHWMVEDVLVNRNMWLTNTGSIIVNYLRQWMASATYMLTLCANQLPLVRLHCKMLLISGVTRERSTVPNIKAFTIKNLLSQHSHPAYLCSPLSYHIPARSLCSSNSNLLSIPQVRTTFASRSFNTAASQSEVTGIQACSSSPTFHPLLQTHCFQQAFILIIMTREKQVSCFNRCPWLYNGEMWSPSTTLSPQSKRRCGHITFLSLISSACGFVLVGSKIIIIIIIIR